MIYPAKYNGINFSSDLNRESQLYNFDAQRLKFPLPKVDFKYLSFFCTGVEAEETAFVNIYGSIAGTSQIAPAYAVSGENPGEWYFYFAFLGSYFLTGTDVYFSFEIDGNFIYSEICEIKHTASVGVDYAHLIASNDDDRHGFLSKEAFGFFKFSQFRSDFFINKSVTFEQSYSRKKILSSENQIAKRLTFYDLTMYQQNLLKWLCNCENLSINGVNYQLISDFSELENDENTEIKSLRADFVESEPSFFAIPSTRPPTSVFPKTFFMSAYSAHYPNADNHDFNKLDFDFNDFK